MLHLPEYISATPPRDSISNNAPVPEAQWKAHSLFSFLMSLTSVNQFFFYSVCDKGHEKSPGKSLWPGERPLLLVRGQHKAVRSVESNRSSTKFWQKPEARCGPRCKMETARTWFCPKYFSLSDLWGQVQGQSLDFIFGFSNDSGLQTLSVEAVCLFKGVLGIVPNTTPTFLLGNSFLGPKCNTPDEELDIGKSHRANLQNFVKTTVSNQREANFNFFGQ